MYDEDDTPLSKQKDNIKNSAQFGNNNTQLKFEDNQKLIDKSKETATTIKSKL